MLKIALKHHQAGEFAQADAIYQQLLQVEPQQPQLWHLWGVLAHQQRQPKAAIERLQQAINLADEPTYYRDLGKVYQTWGELTAAADCFQQAITRQPDDADSHNILGVVWQQLGQVEQAIQYHQQAINLHKAQNKPPTAQSARYWNNAGLAWQTQGDTMTAEQAFQQAIQHHPPMAEAHYNLGNLCLKQHRLTEATTHFETALRFRPDYVKAANNLGISYQRQGQVEAALRCYQQVLQSNPPAESRRHALNNAASTLHQLGRFDEAIAIYQQLLSQPDPMLFNNLGNVWLDKRQVDEAIASFQQAVSLSQETAMVAQSLKNLGAAYHKRGDIEAALAQFQQAYQLEPTPQLRLKIATTLPILYQTEADIATWRHRLTSELADMTAEGVQIDPTVELLALPLNFLAGYQGLNERETQTAIARLYQPQPSIPHVAKVERPAKLRIGFISAHFRQHTVGRLMQGLIARLPREQFEVIIFSLGHFDDSLATFIRQQADSYFPLPPEVGQARHIIAAQQLDLLLYADIGMEPLGYTLAQSRLAPVQAVTWGHSVTSGIQTVDYYVSSSHYESDHAQEHYSEQLVRLHSLNTYYYRPQLSEPLPTKTEFDLADVPHVYMCPQSVYKYHPSFDPLIAEILRRDPQGQVVLLAGDHPQWDSLVLTRFQQSMPDVISRIRFVPRQQPAEFLRLLSIADVILDPPHFGGCNTHLEAFAFGVPVVTMPSEFLRGRFTAGFYTAMGLSDYICESADAYITWAVRLGTDAAYRQEVREQIAAHSHSLYEEQRTIEEWAAFFEQAISLSAMQQAYQAGREALQQGHIRESITHYQTAIDNFTALKPPYVVERLPRYAAKVYDSLGMLLGELGLLEEAATAINLASQLQPQQAEIFNNVGVVWQNQGRVAEAVAAFETAIRLRSDFHGAHSNRLLTMHYLPDSSAAALYEAHQAWGAGFSHRKGKRGISAQDEQKPLKIGYLSADFRHHPVATFIKPLFQHHDRTRFTVFAYSDVAQPDSLTQELSGLVEYWRAIHGQSDEAVRELMQADDLDMLVDLAGHTGGNRLPMLAERVAPVQVSYLGYPNLTGLPSMDYRLTCGGEYQPSEAGERLLPLSPFICYTPPTDAPEIKRLPALTNGFITFGSFNHLPKMNDTLLSWWAQILAALPQARLLLKNIPLSDTGTRARFKSRLEQAGLPLERVILHGYVAGQAAHLAMYQQVDVALDTWPYNGTTTTCEALWMGVPVLTLRGDSHASQVGAHLLEQVGLKEWITHEATSYINHAINLAQQFEPLATLRQSLRQRLTASPLCDGVGFVRQVERALRGIHHEY